MTAGAGETPLVGVVGAGTMGAGIAEAAARAGLPVRLHDPLPEALAGARERIARSLARSVERGRLGKDEAEEAEARLERVDALEALAGCSAIIEAAPEQRDLKLDIFRRLDAACPPPTLLASNTSSLSVTALGTAVADPGRLVGMHFFNPAPVMALVEVVAGAGSAPWALEAAEELALRLGKTAVRVADTPGFVVNRVARPFYGEALRMLSEGVAGVDAIDDAVRQAGFRMGPFELIDLIGVDVNFAVTRSVWEATFYEARYRPHPIQERLVEAGRLGRKSGQGFYAYSETGEPRGPSPGVGPPARTTAGLALPWGGGEAEAVAQALSLPPGGAAGIITRLLAALVNEAVSAVDEGVADPAGIDAAMRLGANHPRGPFEWLEALGPGLVLAVMDGLWDWFREERYRPAPGLRRLASQ
jgi:3-hydroxybutyryl-CoA dehydrogenase